MVAILMIIPGDVYVPGLWKHSVLVNDSKFPVVIFSHGIGGNRTTYTTVCCELASQGFVVAALEHRYGGRGAWGGYRGFDGRAWRREYIGLVGEIELRIECSG